MAVNQELPVHISWPQYVFNIANSVCVQTENFLCIQGLSFPRPSTPQPQTQLTEAMAQLLVQFVLILSNLDCQFHLTDESSMTEGKPFQKELHVSLLQQKQYSLWHIFYLLCHFISLFTHFKMRQSCMQSFVFVPGIPSARYSAKSIEFGAGGGEPLYCKEKMASNWVQLLVTSWAQLCHFYWHE